MQKASLGTVVTAIASTLGQCTNTSDDSFSSGRVAEQNGEKITEKLQCKICEFSDFAAI